jgi:hypothetical protein
LKLWKNFEAFEKLEALGRNLKLECNFGRTVKLEV